MKTWEKPQLVVLVRGKQEEAILTACKDWRAGEAGSPAGAQVGCENFDWACALWCQELIHS